MFGVSPEPGKGLIPFPTLHWKPIQVVAVHQNPVACVFSWFWGVFARFRAFFCVLVGCCTLLRVFAYFSALGVPLVALGTLLGALGTLLGRSWDALGALLGALGRSWGALEALLGRSWSGLGAEVLRFWALLGLFRTVRAV